MAKSHVNTPECWCRPAFLVGCEECDGGGCWKCKRGLVAITRQEARQETKNVIIVHQPFEECYPCRT